MARGRKRKHNPHIPPHIDQARLPAGIYWDRSGLGRWYVFEPHPEGGGPRTRKVAGPTARLSDLHSIMELRSGQDARGTIGHVMTLFHGSTEWQELSPGSRDTYENDAKTIRSFRTLMGATLDTLVVDRLDAAAIQRVVEVIAKGKPESRKGAGDAIPPYPSKAAHMLRYLRRTLAWGVRMGHCKTNPAAGVRNARERKNSKMPSPEAYAAVLEFARLRASRKPHSKGSGSPYLPPLMEIDYLCRMRGIEGVNLTYAHASLQGLYVSRVKGSNDNIVEWNERLFAAWNSAVELRRSILAKAGAKHRPQPDSHESTFLFLAEDGARLSKSGLDTAWQRLMQAAVKESIITKAQRYGLHGLKHRGVTDTKGNKADKKLASGHKTDAMADLYDHDVPLVKPAGQH